MNELCLVIGFLSNNGCQFPSVRPFFSSRFGLKKDGTGLGLSIIKQIIDLQKGEITVDGKIGKGTTFTLRLPVR